jgi:predicted enzyme related to lactoylglutathione lyase
MDNGEVYVMMKHKGQDLLGLYTLNAEQLQQGVPPHWMAYIAVEQADQAVAMATSLGGTAVMPAFDVMEHGRMSILRDPQGATFAIWEAKQHPGAGIVNDNGSVCWTELATTDRVAAGAFYSKLFGYEIKEMDMEGGFTYSVLRKDEADKGGIIEITEDWGDVPPHFANYVGVADCDVRAAQAEALGGKVVVPPMDIPNVGRFANLQDPSGAHFSIITFEMPAGA